MKEIEAFVKPEGFLSAFFPELSLVVRFPARAVYATGSARLRPFSGKPGACRGGFLKPQKNKGSTGAASPMVTFPAGHH
jgi:hypothetical protein